MPPTVRTVNRAYSYLIFAVLVIAALTIAVLALWASNQTGECVNRVLGERAHATDIESAAELRNVRAEADWLRGRISRTQYAEAGEALQSAKKAAAVYRQAHPAGRC